MAQKFANQQGFIYCFSQQTLLIKTILVYTRNDDFILLRNVNRQNMDQIKKNVIKIFKKVGFKIEIRTHLKIVNFFDVTFNLTNGTYQPYKKPNDPLFYVNTSSNHPPQVIKYIPTSISKKLNKNSSSEKFSMKQNQNIKQP